jgi:4a-hydroxytetrahydrobiopterin dehydratase
MRDQCSILAEKECVPCKGGVPPLTGEALQDCYSQLGNDWQLVEEHHLEKEFKFKDFQSALDFVNRVGAIAEEQNHHPDLELGWGRAKVTIYTHKINGLTVSDFIFAAKAEKANT